jgi:hypothetical protein
MVGARQRLLTSLALKVENHCWIQSLHPNSERKDQDDPTLPRGGTDRIQVRSVGDSGDIGHGLFLDTVSTVTR